MRSVSCSLVIDDFLAVHWLGSWDRRPSVRAIENLVLSNLRDIHLHKVIEQAFEVVSVVLRLNEVSLLVWNLWQEPSQWLNLVVLEVLDHVLFAILDQCLDLFEHPQVFLLHWLLNGLLWFSCLLRFLWHASWIGLLLLGVLLELHLTRSFSRRCLLWIVWSRSVGGLVYLRFHIRILTLFLASYLHLVYFDLLALSMAYCAPLNLNLILIHLSLLYLHLLTDHILITWTDVAVVLYHVEILTEVSRLLLATILWWARMWHSMSLHLVLHVLDWLVKIATRSSNTTTEGCLNFDALLWVALIAHLNLLRPSQFICEAPSPALTNDIPLPSAIALRQLGVLVYEGLGDWCEFSLNTSWLVHDVAFLWR